eukprot:m.41851 g.41851  ORF g.41851 m.41851 type:complete len:155 (+) comp10464_c0_seq2:37-501(+)
MHWWWKGVESGVFGAFAGCVLKIALGKGVWEVPLLLNVVTDNRENSEFEAFVFGYSVLSVVDAITRLLCVVLFVVCNSRMWIAFSLALDQSTTSVVPTIINFVSNTVTSIVVGWALFGESLTVWDLIASVCMCSGAVILLQDNNSNKRSKEKRG